ncbi:hypothetical protein AVEN_112996-1 [Araneus ventricosus]|uniref:Uncharacterized protein n=1 Tax=Araneus ventricosus TaxID=182803 RepID=A0A4Y2QLM5_ARAVE|nr:hypothetical protein AVEN_112996-1 [Araneus ventricosus]
MFPCFRDLGTSDYSLFPNMRKWLTGTDFASNDEVISGTTPLGNSGECRLTLAMGILKKKPNRRRGGFKFFNDGLRTLRNTTNKLYNIFKRKRQSDSPEAEIHTARAEYNRSRAIYKKQLLIAKR